MIREGEFDPSKVRNAMLEEGGIALPSEKVDLRFPTMSMAETAHRHLCEKLPRGYWSNRSKSGFDIEFWGIRLFPLLNTLLLP